MFIHAQHSENAEGFMYLKMKNYTDRYTSRRFEKGGHSKFQIYSFLRLYNYI